MAAYFELILVIATLVTGLVWGVDRMVFLPKRRLVVAGLPDVIEEEARNAVLQESALVENCRGIFPVIAFVLILRSFFYEPFQIPSGSMRSTLLVGDFILVEKFAYGVKLPVLRDKIIEVGLPERGDVVVFKYPPEPTLDYIKRVIGLPGDTIRYRNKRLSIKPACVADNSVACDKFVQVTIDIISSGDFVDDGYPLSQANEDLLGINHEILFNPAASGQSRYPNAPRGEWLVPQGHYFMMGDNRDNSLDSRFWGFVPERNLVGKAVFIWTSFEFERAPSDWIPTWVPSGIRTERLGPIGQ
ncbi:MAG: signal peptidase I [Psychrobium sp.]|nr:signal peptidase I [Psychrobium sp.]